jgi:catechol 2,3-dioxygenase-like lactoylglutathione lyase family enzyme
MPELFRVMPMLVASMLIGASSAASADVLDPAGLDADKLAGLIAERPGNEGRVGTMNFVLTNAAGVTRERRALMAHADLGETVRIAIFFEMPAAIQETAFLSHEHRHRADEAWLYLPATERVRRIPASSRGDYFLGTDLTYGDIKDNFRFGLEDWRFSGGDRVEHEGRTMLTLHGEIADDETARATGYGAFSALVDPETLFPLQIDYVDVDGVALKRVEVVETGQVGGVWTALRFRVQQHQSGHRTEVFFTDMRHVPDLPARVFEPSALALGVPRIR